MLYLMPVTIFMLLPLTSSAVAPPNLLNLTQCGVPGLLKDTSGTSTTEPNRMVYASVANATDNVWVGRLWNRCIEGQIRSEMYPVCAATLISDGIFLTAAHCVLRVLESKNKKEGHFTCGQYYRTVSHGDLHDHYYALKPSFLAVSVIGIGYRLQVVSIILHPELERVPRYKVAIHDIAMIVTKRFGLISAMPICLPIEPVADYAELESFFRCKAAGWGAINIIATTYPNVLMEADLPIVSLASCKEDYGKLPDRVLENLPNSVCAGRGGQSPDTCAGDSGTGLVCQKSESEEIFYLAGVTSFGYKRCGDKPAFYVRVDQYLDWILSIFPYAQKDTIDNTVSRGNIDIDEETRKIIMNRFGSCGPASIYSNMGSFWNFRMHSVLLIISIFANVTF